MEWLSYAVANLNLRGSIQGIKIARPALTCTHSFYVDDTNLFFKANQASFMVIKDLLNRYELISGQQVNFDKSDMLVSKHCSLGLRNFISTHLGIRFANGRIQYLGSLLLLQRSKASCFKDLIDKAWNKVSMWSARRLLVGRIEVLIKLVLLAIPQYIMLFYMLPEKILNSLIREVSVLVGRKKKNQDHSLGQ